MNKYHKHQSKGLNRPNYQAVGQLRCPVTGKLIEPSYSITVAVVEEGKDRRILAGQEKTSNGKAYTFHLDAFLVRYNESLKDALGVQA